MHRGRHHHLAHAPLHSPPHLPACAPRPPHCPPSAHRAPARHRRRPSAARARRRGGIVRTSAPVHTPRAKRHRALRPPPGGGRRPARPVHRIEPHSPPLVLVRMPLGAGTQDVHGKVADVKGDVVQRRRGTPGRRGLWHSLRHTDACGEPPGLRTLPPLLQRKELLPLQPVHVVVVWYCLMNTFPANQGGGAR